MAHPAVFLDRDGTLIEEVGYATRPEQIRILGGAARGLARLAAAGYKIVVATNQSAIARGLLTEDDLNRLHQCLDEQLDVLGARIDAYYACPHLPDAAAAKRPELAVVCDCRKPKPGLLLHAAGDMGLDLSASWMIGDTWRDIGAGQAAGVRTIKVPADSEHSYARPADVLPPTAEAENLDEAADIILAAPRTVPVAEPATDRLAVAGTATTTPEAESPEPEPAPPVAPPAPKPPVMPGLSGNDPFAVTLSRPEGASEGSRRGRGLSAGQQQQPQPATGGLREGRNDNVVPASEAPGTPQPPIVAATDPGKQPPGHATLDTEARPGTDSCSRQQPREHATHDIAPSPPASHCARCGQAIRDADLITGRADRRDGLLLCPDCLGRIPRVAEEPLPADSAGLLRAILLELRRTGRGQRPASLGFLRLLAYLAQAGAVATGLVLVLVSEAPADRSMFLQIAIFLQLIVVTLLLLERNS